MSDKINDNTNLEIIYFEGEDTSKNKTIFEGNVNKFLENVTTNEEFKGFEKGDRFMIGDRNVRVFKLSEDFDVNGILTNVKYYVGDKEVNPNNLTF